jgi:hypothetical protein
MKIVKYVLCVGVVGFLLTNASGCKHQQTDADGIRIAITQHLQSLNTLNLQAMDMDVTNISVTGTQAKADASFRPKTGAPAGALMQISYSLEKSGDVWRVLRPEGMGGAIDHPAPGSNPHNPPGQNGSHGSLPNVHDFFPKSNPGSNDQVPPGHPPVTKKPHQ